MVAKQKLLRTRKVSVSLNKRLNETGLSTELNQSIESNDQLKLLSSLPFIIFLFGSLWYLPKFLHGGFVSSNIDEGGVFRQVFFGLSYLLAAVSLWRNMRLVTPLLMQQWLQGVLLALVLGSTLWSTAPAKVLINFGHLSGALLIALTMGFNLCKSPLHFFRILALFEIVTLGVSILLALMLPAYGQILIGDTLRWSGVGTHPNQLGIFGAIGVWTALALFDVSSVARDKKLALLLLAAGLVVIIGADSVTSLIVAITMLGWFLYIGKSANLRSAVLRMFLGAFSVIILMLVVHVVAPEILNLGTLFGVAGRSDNFTGRTELWAIARQAIEERTLVGWGFDSLHSLGAKFGIAYGQFHNGYLDLMVRGGVLALVIVIVMLLRAVFSGFRYWTAYPKIVVAGLGLCVFVLLHNVTEASLVRPTHPLWLLLLAAIVALGFCNSMPKIKDNKGLDANV
jgi:exopolysaccharide production protein ExoQ